VVWYLDTSALLKLVVAEEHSKAMRTWVKQRPAVVSSDLLRTEAIRTARRISTEAVAAARVALEGVDIGAMTSDIFERAAELDPSILRTLDALHLAWALSLGDELEGIVTYDDRLGAAARIYGVRVLAPG
jgi:predicted nucleic acid-binding protein